MGWGGPQTPMRVGQARCSRWAVILPRRASAVAGSALRIAR